MMERRKNKKTDRERWERERKIRKENTRESERRTGVER